MKVTFETTVQDSKGVVAPQVVVPQAEVTVGAKISAEDVELGVLVYAVAKPEPVRQEDVAKLQTMAKGATPAESLRLSVEVFGLDRPLTFGFEAYLNLGAFMGAQQADDLVQTVSGSLLAVSEAQAQSSYARLPREQIGATLAGICSGDAQAAVSAFAKDLRLLTPSVAESGAPVDVNALVQWVIREGYLESTKDLYMYAEKVKTFNGMKKAVRDQLSGLRTLQSAFAGVKNEDKATTSLAGAGGSVGAAGTNAGSAVVDSALTVDTFNVAVVSPSQRLAEYPQMDALVAKFTAVENLHAVFKSDRGSQAELLRAIPYMTHDELKTVLQRFGGQDLSGGDLSAFWSNIVRSLTPLQVLELQQDPPAMYVRVGTHTSHHTYHGKRRTRHSPVNGWVSGLKEADSFRGESAFRIAFLPHFAVTQSKILNATGMPKGTPAKSLIDTWRAKTAADANASKAVAQATAATVRAVPSTPKIDFDASDGSIDAVQVVDQPPYLRATGEKIDTVAKLEAAVKEMEEKLNSVGDDAQLANVDLQNMLQKQQQSLQMLSNISKSLQDTAMAIIRQMGG